MTPKAHLPPWAVDAGHALEARLDAFYSSKSGMGIAEFLLSKTREEVFADFLAARFGPLVEAARPFRRAVEKAAENGELPHGVYDYVSPDHFAAIHAVLDALNELGVKP